MDKCKDCCFFYPAKKDWERPNEGECRAHPPVVAPISGGWSFPWIPGSLRCGEWIDKKESKNERNNGS